MNPEDVVDVEAIEEVAASLPAVRQSEAIVARGEISVEEVVAQKDKIRQVMQSVMTEGVHYGLIPGVNKPSLFKPGAEAINVALRLAPHYDSEKIWHDDGHLTVVSKCTLKHIPTDLTIATGEGLCTTKETRYAFRQGGRKCPNCEAEAIKKSKFAPKPNDYEGAKSSDPPGWYCFSKIGGCGMNFAADDPRITSQTEGRVPNPDIADTYNTVLKMADKRALVAAVLNGTAASDVFTQDVEDGPTASGSPEPVVETRRENDGLLAPTSWTRITEYASAYDEGTYKTFTAFGDAARRRLFPDSASASKLKKEEKDELFQVTSKAIMALREAIEPSAFPPPTTDDIRKAWAIAMEGEELSIPEEAVA